jgi:hypothetical protein
MAAESAEDRKRRRCSVDTCTVTLAALNKPNHKFHKHAHALQVIDSGQNEGKVWLSAFREPEISDTAQMKCCLCHDGGKGGIFYGNEDAVVAHFKSESHISAQESYERGLATEDNRGHIRQQAIARFFALKGSTQRSIDERHPVRYSLPRFC